MMTKPKQSLWLVLAFVGGLVVSSVWQEMRMARALEALRDDLSLQRQLAQPVPTASGGAYSAFQPVRHFQQAADRSVGAVVFISTSQSSRYGRFGGYGEGSGSGVIISPQGYIVTNYHVVKEATDITVTLNDKREFAATLAGADPNTDLAVLKIDAEDLPTLRFANSDSTRIGQWVLAVGNPFRLTSTVTTGIVSAKARNIGIIRQHARSFAGQDYSIESFIQTDAAINPGNSGGALVNLDGDLVGINTAIATETGTYQGYGFAIPSNLVRKIVADLMAYGSVQRAYIGVSIRDINAQLAEQYGLSSLRGALVATLSDDGAARRAGIQTGDVIIAVEGVLVDGPSELQERVAQYRPGDQVRITLLRGDQTLQRTLTLRNEKGTTTMSKANPARLPNTLARVGLRLQAFTTEELAEEGLRYGLRIRDVVPGGPAHKAGIRPGMILLKVQGTAVSDLEEATHLLAEHPEKVELEVRKPDGRKTWFVLRF